jgi:hypothetical protein
MRKGFSKSSTVLFAAAVSVLIGLLGCENTTSSPGKDYTGVLGELSGVVFDEITGLPIEGVMVSNGERSAWTNAAGAFTIDKVIPGTYTVSYSKNGYRIATQKNITVDPLKYLTDDPYLEVDAYNKYAALFTQWLADRAAVQLEMAQEDLPTLYGNGWTYNGGGTFTAESGDVQVTYNEAKDDFDFTFEPTEIKKLEYTYRYGITLQVVALKPLNGGFAGEVKIVLADVGSVAKPAPIAAPAGLKVYFRDSGIDPDAGNTPVGEDGLDDTRDVAGIYKAETDRNGKFSVTGLPANTIFDIIVDNFSHTVAKETFYFDGTKLYQLSDNTTTITALTPKQTQANGPTTLLPILLFAEKEVVFVSAYKAGSLAEPLPVRDKEGVDAQGKPTVQKAEIEVTFTEALDPTSFAAYLDDTTTGNGYGSVRLKAIAWSKDNKTVTLVAAERPSGGGYGTITLPYNVFTVGALPDEGPTGILHVSAKKADGTEAFVASTVPVFTEERIKLLSVEVVDPADLEDRPTRSLFTVKVGGAVKLTFSKPIADNNANTYFTFVGLNTKENPDYRIVDNVVYVYIDQKIPFSERTAINYWVVSKTHSDDFIGQIGVAGIPTVDQFTTYGLQQLVVSKTNLYDPVLGLSATGFQNGFSYFPVGDNIEITFTREIVGGTAEAELFLGDPTALTDKITNKVPLAEGAVVVDGNTVTITHPDLEPHNQYYLSLNVFDEAGDLIYTTEGIGTTGLTYADAAVDDYIAFTTAHKKLLLVSTNLYDPKYQDDTSHLTVTPFLALNDPIDLIFDQPIPLTSPKTGFDNITVLLDTNDPPNAGTAIPIRPVEVVNDTTLRITPIRSLAGGAPHYLSVQIQYGTQNLFDTDSDDYWEFYDGKYVAVRSTDDAIAFMPENILSIDVTDPDLSADIEGDDDIIITFNKVIALDTQNTKLYFVDDDDDAHELVQGTDYTLTAEGKTVIVSPNFTLAETTGNEEFELALYVTSNEDGKPEQYVADDHWKDNQNVIFPYATIDGSITFTVGDTKQPNAGPILSSQKPVVDLGVISNLSNEVRNNATIDLSWTVVPADEVADYTVWYKWQNGLGWTTAAPTTIPSASTSHVERVIVPPKDSPIVPIDYMVTGKNEKGLVKQGSLTGLTVLGTKLDFATDTTIQVDSNTGALQWSLRDDIGVANPELFYPDQDIVLVFNKDIASVSDNVFYYLDTIPGTPVLRESVATFTVAGKTVTVHPTNLLVVSKRYEISLKVTAQDGDTLVYSTAAIEVANDDTVVEHNIYFGTAGTLSVGSSALPIDLNVRAVNFDNNLATIAAPVPNAITAVGLSWAVPAGGATLTDGEYFIHNKYSDSVWTTDPDKTRAASGTSGVTYRLSGTYDLATAQDDAKRTIVYGVTGTSKQGFALGGTVEIVVNAPRIELEGIHSSAGIAGTLPAFPGTIQMSNLAIDEDIVFEFNKEVVGATAVLYLYQGPGNVTLLGTTGATPDYIVEAGDRVVAIRPRYLLGGNQNFRLKLTVTAEDGDVWVSDGGLYPPVVSPTRYENPADIEISTPTTVAVPLLDATFAYAKQPRAANLAVSAPAGGGSGMAATTTTLTLQWPRPAIPASIAQPYGIWERLTGNTVTPVLSATYTNVTAANVTQVLGTGAGGISGHIDTDAPHNAYRPINYIFEAVDGSGFLVQGTRQVTFTN